MIIKVSNHWLAAVALAVCPVAGCSRHTGVGHLYRSVPWHGSTVFDIRISDPCAEYGHVKVTTPKSIIVGEYSSSVAAAEVDGSKKSTLSVGYAGAHGSLGSTSSSSVKYEPGMAWRSATIVGDGLEIWLSFQVDLSSGHGSGTGHDNHYGTYTLQF